jgi:hypothetical protein
MENSERKKFDNAWRDAFQQAEQSPSAEVWAALDHELTRAEGGAMKRKVVFYQRLAAASILFALLFGSLTTYYNLKQTTGGVDLVTTNQSPDQSGTTIPDQNIKAGEVGAGEDKALTENGSGVPKSGNHKANGNSIFNKSDQSAFIALSKKDSDATEEMATAQMIRQSSVHARTIAGISTQDLPSPEVKISGKPREVTIVRKLPAMPASFMADTRKEKKSGEDLWASVGASAGNYSPQTNLNSNAFAAAPASGAGALTKSASSNAYSQGSAYSVGLSVTKRVANHWVLQGGLSYLNQAIGYTSNFAVTSANKTSAYVADYATLNQNASTVALTNPYEINSVNQFVSLPVQAGYLLVDRTFGWQLNTGVATDIFLQNTLTDESGQFDKYTEGAGEDSPYRTLSWSALMSTELSYKIGTQYRVSLAPGLRYTMSPVLKSEAVSGNPIVWDLGFKFRYIFK